MKNPTKYGTKELAYLKKVLKAKGGNWCEALEREFAKSVNAKYAVAMNSGTATLHASLEAVGVGAGDEVISPALTVIMDTTATLHANAIPVYADIDPHTFNISPEDIKQKITPKTKAIIVVSLYGLPCDMEAINAIASERGIPVIEDNAQCFLSTYKGKPLGAFSDISSWSFENSKHMSCGEGGIITTDNEEYAALARKVAGHGYSSLGAEYGRVKLNQSVYQDPEYKRHSLLGWNYRLNEFSAAVALAQLETLEGKVSRRKMIAHRFLEEVSKCDFLRPQLVPDDREHSYFTLGLVFSGEEERGISWKTFREKYIEFGGDGFYSAWSVPYLEPIITEKMYRKRCPSIYNTVEYERGLCPVAESLQPRLIQLKTNYRDLKLASQKAAALRSAIQYFN